jgi:hypothetical protein
MKATKDIQLLMGIEAFLLGREWLVLPEPTQQLQVGEFYLVLDELHSELLKGQPSKALENENTKTLAAEKIRKRYEPYLNEVRKKFNFDFSFQSKITRDFESNNEAIYQISRLLIKDICINYSDEALKIVLTNWKKPYDLPAFLVLLRYSMKFGFPIEFYYTKLMQNTSKPRRVFPYLLTVTGNHLGLISYDTKDKNIKSFLLSRIQVIYKNFLKDYRISRSNGFKRPQFDYMNYLKKDPYSKFQKIEVKYQIRIHRNNFDLFKHSIQLPFKVLEERENDLDLEVKSYDERNMFDILYNYGCYAELLKPEDARLRFINSLESILNQYSKK